MLTSVGVIGAGGHCKVVVEAIAKMNSNCTISIFDTDETKTGDSILGYEVQLFTSPELTPDTLFVAIGDNQIRESVTRMLNKEGKTLATVLHPDANLSTSSRVDEGTLVAALAVVSSDATVGKGCIINHRAVIDHDCTIGDFAHIAPQVTLGGGVSVGRYTLVGANATILPKISVGENVTIGAGSVVIKDVPDNQTVVGNPAKTI